MGVFIWLGLLIAFLIAEGFTVALISLWFALGALTACLAALLEFSIWAQVTVFLVTSALALAALRPLAYQYLKPRITATNVDSVVGTLGVVTTSVDNLEGHGQVKLGSMVWTARSSTGEAIPAGTTVKVDRVEGVKVFVTPAYSTIG